MTGLRVLVCTVVHNPEDARIFHRQIRAMLDAGYDVTYAAPFSAYGVDPAAGGHLLNMVAESPS